MAGNAICIDVIDTGIGHSRLTRSNRCSKFVQAEASTTRRFGGTGLDDDHHRGLARAMGGDIAARASMARAQRSASGLTLGR